MYFICIWNTLVLMCKNKDYLILPYLCLHYYEFLLSIVGASVLVRVKNETEITKDLTQVPIGSHLANVDKRKLRFFHMKHQLLAIS